MLVTADRCGGEESGARAATRPQVAALTGSRTGSTTRLRTLLTAHRFLLLFLYGNYVQSSPLH